MSFSAVEKPSRKLTGSPLVVGDLSHKNFVTVPVSSTVSDAIQWVRQSAVKGNIFYIYVVDSRQTLCGIVSIRNLLLASDEDTVSAIYSPGVVSLPKDLPLNEAYAVFSRSKFLSLPIVDEQNHIFGVLPAHELVEEYKKGVDELFEERSRGELFELLGIKAEDTTSGPFGIAAHRLPWLMVNVVGGGLSAFFIHRMGGGLRNAVEALAFVPILLIVSESVGMQTASVVITQIHRTSSRLRFFKTLFREGCASLLIGAVCGAIVAGFVYLLNQNWQLALPVFLTLTVGSFLVASLGTLIPFTFHRLRVDPRVAAGPVVLAIADSGVLLIYLLLCLAMMR